MGIELKADEIEALAKHFLAGNSSLLELEERPGLTSASLTLTEEDSAEIAGLADRIPLLNHRGQLRGRFGPL